MAEVFVHAAVAARPNITYFFIQDQYVVYRYGPDERVLDGVHSVDTFPPGAPTSFPDGFFGGQQGRLRKIDAALMGKAQYDGALYFFNGSRYCRYDWGVGFTAAGVAVTGPGWNLPAPADQPDAAMNESLRTARM